MKRSARRQAVRQDVRSGERGDEAVVFDQTDARGGTGRCDRETGRADAGADIVEKTSEVRGDGRREKHRVRSRPVTRRRLAETQLSAEKRVARDCGRVRVIHR